MKTINVKPRAGIILAGIPASGTDVDAALAEEWLANGLVVRVNPKTAKRTTEAVTHTTETPEAPAKGGN